MKILFAIALFSTLSFTTNAPDNKITDGVNNTCKMDDVNINAYKAVPGAGGGPDAYFNTKACRSAFLLVHTDYSAVAGTFSWPEDEVFTCV